MKNFKELNIWRNGIVIVKDTYVLCRQLPREEKFGLSSQMTRAATSIPANIAEGNSRNSDRDNARFIQIALGSAFELQTYLVIVRELAFANEQETIALEVSLLEQIKMMQAFLRRLNND